MVLIPVPLVLLESLALFLKVVVVLELEYPSAEHKGNSLLFHKGIPSFCLSYLIYTVHRP